MVPPKGKSRRPGKYDGAQTGLTRAQGWKVLWLEEDGEEHLGIGLVMMQRGRRWEQRMLARVE